MVFKYAVALTGSIATGKSSVAQILKNTGYDIIDADSISHDILEEEKDAIAQIFGTDIIKDSNIDRNFLRRIVFGDAKKRKILESHLHPLIQKRIKRLSIKLDENKQIYFIDIPLFYETGNYSIDKVLVVYTPREIQLKRLIERDRISQDEAKKRISLQIDIEEKIKYASHVIDNSGTLRELENATLRIIKENFQKESQ